MVHRRHKLAHQHVETAVPGQGDDLARAIERLDSVGLTKRSPNSGIVEGSQDPLRSTLPNPIAGPKRVEAGIDEKHRIAFGGIADRPRHRLRMDTVLAALRVRLLVEHRVPLLTFACHSFEKTAVALGRNPPALSST